MSSGIPNISLLLLFNIFLSVTSFAYIELEYNNILSSIFNFEDVKFAIFASFIGLLFVTVNTIAPANTIITTIVIISVIKDIPFFIRFSPLLLLMNII